MKGQDDAGLRTSATTTIGLLVAPGSGRIPPDGNMLYRDAEVRFISQGLGIGEVSASGFDAVEATILEKARLLSAAGATQIILMGTSLTFYKGPTYTDDLRDEMAEVSKVPCTTMSHALVDSLRALGVNRPAVATPYIDELNVALHRYLVETGLEVQSVEGLGIRGLDAMRQVSRATIVELAQRAVAEARSPDGLLISCTGLNTLPLHVELEEMLDLPVTSSAPAGFWQVMRLAGLETDRPGFGRLFALGNRRGTGTAASRWTV